jgi:hypothetical protein
MSTPPPVVDTARATRALRELAEALGAALISTAAMALIDLTSIRSGIVLLSAAREGALAGVSRALRAEIEAEVASHLRDVDGPAPSVKGRPS